jgi:prephenate dehydratase
VTATLGALGGPHTFGGQAASALVLDQPELGEVVYLPNSGQLFADDGQWRVDAACVPAHTSRAGAHLSTHRKLTERSDMYVIAEIDHAYRCALLVKPGTALKKIKTVLGHTGSLNQSRAWLTTTIPQAEPVVVDTHSKGAALAVAQADGTLAAVGTTDLAAETGLEILAHDIDGGSVGRYWAVGPHAPATDRPDRVVVAGKTESPDDLNTALQLLHVGGFRVVVAFSEAVGDRLLHNRVVLYGYGTPTSNLELLTNGFGLLPSFRLAGAYVATGSPPGATMSSQEGASIAH